MPNQEPKSKPEGVEEPRDEGLDETACSLTDSELLRELLDCFYHNGIGLEWSYVEGTSIGEVLSPAMDARLQEIKANSQDQSSPRD